MSPISFDLYIDAIRERDAYRTALERIAATDGRKAGRLAVKVLAGQEMRALAKPMMSYECRRDLHTLCEGECWCHCDCHCALAAPPSPEQEQQ